MSELKITVDQLKNYLGTGLKFKLLYDCYDEFYELEDSKGYQKAFTEGSIWKFVGWSDLELPMGEGEFSAELLQHESGIYMGNYGTHKPIFFCLSDLDKFIPELGFVPIEKIGIYNPNDKIYLIEQFRCGWIEKIIFDKLIQWHFWPFGDEYFENRLVINKLTYGKEGDMKK